MYCSGKSCLTLSLMFKEALKSQRISEQEMQPLTAREDKKEPKRSAGYAPMHKPTHGLCQGLDGEAPGISLGRTCPSAKTCIPSPVPTAPRTLPGPQHPLPSSCLPLW